MLTAKVRGYGTESAAAGYGAGAAIFAEPIKSRRRYHTIVSHSLIADTITNLIALIRYVKVAIFIARPIVVGGVEKCPGHLNPAGVALTIVGEGGAGEFGVAAGVFVGIYTTIFVAQIMMAFLTKASGF